VIKNPLDFHEDKVYAVLDLTRNTYAINPVVIQWDGDFEMK